MKRFSYLLLCLACFAVLALGACDKDDPKTPDQTEQPDDNPVDPENPDDNPDNPGIDEVAWPESLEKSLFGVWASVTSDFGLIRVELKPDRSFILMETSDLRVGGNLKFAEGKFSVNESDHSVVFVFSESFDINSKELLNNNSMILTLSDYKAVEFSAKATGLRENESMTFHKVTSSEIVKPGTKFEINKEADEEMSSVSLFPDVAKVSGDKVETYKPGTTYIGIETSGGTAYTEVLVSAITKLPYDKITGFVKLFVDYNNPEVLSPGTSLKIKDLGDTYGEYFDSMALYNSDHTTSSEIYSIEIQYNVSEIPDLAMLKILNDKYTYLSVANIGQDCIVFTDKDMSGELADYYGYRWYPAGSLYYPGAFYLLRDPYGDPMRR